MLIIKPNNIYIKGWNLSFNYLYLIKKLTAMRNKFIQVNDNVNKAIAFANTLELENIQKTQRIKTPEFYVPTIEAIEGLRKDGWRLEGVWEERNKFNRKISHHGIRMQHPDLMFETNGKVDAIASITMTNSTDGNKPLVAHLGAFRQVCSNGLIAFRGTSVSVNHKTQDQTNLLEKLFSITPDAQQMLNDFAKYKGISLTKEQIDEFARKVSNIRWGTNDTNHRVNELLRVARLEDEGNSLWAVMNRVQENATHNIGSLGTDIQVNRIITELASEYALN